MILIRHASDQSIHRLHQDRVIIVASIAVHRLHVDIIKNVDAAQAVVVIVVVATQSRHCIQGIQIDQENEKIQDVNGHRVDQAKAVTNMTSIRMIKAIHEVIATNKVVIEFVDFWACQ